MPPRTQALAQGEPGADHLARAPRAARTARPQRGKSLSPAGAASADLRGGDQDRGRGHRGAPPPSNHGCAETGHDRQPGGHPERDREVVVGLADPLREKVPRARRPARDVEVEGAEHGAARRADRPDQLEVLEDDVAVVATGTEQRAAPDGEGAGEVGSHGAVQQRPRRVPERVPRHGVEVVLWPHAVGELEHLDGADQRPLARSARRRRRSRPPRGCASRTPVSTPPTLPIGVSSAGSGRRWRRAAPRPRRDARRASCGEPSTTISSTQIGEGSQVVGSARRSPRSSLQRIGST